MLPEQHERLSDFATRLIDQQASRVLIPANEPEVGFWFGGGNMVEVEDRLYVVGRFRDAGDSRTGVAAGRRGWELAILESTDSGVSFRNVLRLAKSDLAVGDQRVLSIEGSALRWTETEFELFVSTEKDGVGYPPGLGDYLKPGTGVWSVDRLAAPTLEALADSPRETILETTDPRFLHIKDPFLHTRENGDLVLLFCSHPFCWTSSNTGYAIRRAGQQRFSEPVFDFFPRGLTWDVAITRGTCLLDVPKIGAFADSHRTLMFYDGGECVRNHDEHATAVSRPRGYSCEELGGVAVTADGDFNAIERLSVNAPLFVSPHGSGCSRYVDVLETSTGYFATWQQSQPDGSQPLVMNFVPRDVVRDILC